MNTISVKIRTASQLTDIGESTIRDAINRQELTAFRVGREIRIKIADLETWLDTLTRVGSEDDRP